MRHLVYNVRTSLVPINSLLRPSVLCDVKRHRSVVLDVWG